MRAPAPCWGFVAISRPVSLRRLTEYAWGRLIQWARYLVNTRSIQLAMRQCPPEADAAFFSDSFFLNGPVPGSSYAGACMQFATGDPAVSGAVMSGVPPKLGGSSGAAELTMASVAVKEAVAHRIQVAELSQGPWGSTPLYLGAFEGLHGTTADQVSREMK